MSQGVNVWGANVWGAFVLGANFGGLMSGGRMSRGRLSGHPLQILSSIQPFLGNKNKFFPYPANLAEKKILIIPLESREHQQKISFLSFQSEVTPGGGEY